jgi:hypothetical protein
MSDSEKSLYEHLHDPARLAALRAVAILDSPMEEAYDRLSRIASLLTNSPVALISLVDKDRQFFKSSSGLPEPWKSRRETPLSHSFCQHNRTAGKPLIISNATKDPLFRDNAAVAELNVVAYLGIPLVTADNYVLGSFCVIAVMNEIELRTEMAENRRFLEERDTLIIELEKALKTVKELSGLLPICSYCKKIRDENGNWQQLEMYFEERSVASFTHGICRECINIHYADIDMDGE